MPAVEFFEPVFVSLIGTDGGLRLEVLEPGDVISPAGLIYASLVVNSLRRFYGGGIAVDGDVNNALFFVSSRTGD
nr:hypothetical protein GCM10010200_084030 [Actinomadura rugatobispora]